VDAAALAAAIGGSVVGVAGAFGDIQVVRFNNNYVLRLTAVEEPCSVRRAILEGEWRFLD
jgi:hypothetical protein